MGKVRSQMGPQGSFCLLILEKKKKISFPKLCFFEFQISHFIGDTQTQARLSDLRPLIEDWSLLDPTQQLSQCTCQLAFLPPRALSFGWHRRKNTVTSPIIASSSPQALILFALSRGVKVFPLRFYEPQVGNFTSPQWLQKPYNLSYI